MHILLLEDDIELGEAIKHALEHQCYAVTWLTDGRQGAASLSDTGIDLILLDLGLPGKDGLDVLLEARRAGVKTPILVMTARDATESRIKGLDLGADDYLVKPFDLGELAARIRSLTRRAQGLVENRVEVGSLVLDLATKGVTFRGELVTLTRREFAVLRILTERAGRIVRRETLEGSVYGYDTVVDRNAIEVHVHWLRRKLSSEVIHTVRGIGYMMPREPK
jgi:two-component system response regulator QseB